MNLRRTHATGVAAAKAGFSRATGYRIVANEAREAASPAPRGRRRPDPLAGIFGAEVAPILKNRPGIRPVAVFDELLRRHPDLDPGARRARTPDPRLARRARPRAGGHLPPAAAARPARVLRLHPHGRARRPRRRPTPRSPALPLPPALVRLRPCPGGPGRRELHRPRRGVAECAVAPRRRSPRAPHRQPLGGLSQPAPGPDPRPHPALPGTLRPLRHGRLSQQSGPGSRERRHRECARPSQAGPRRRARPARLPGLRHP